MTNMVKVIAFIHTYAQDGDYGSFMKELMQGFSHDGVKLYVFKVNDLVGKLHNTKYLSQEIENTVLDKIKLIKPNFIFSTNRGGITKSIMDSFPNIPRVTWMVDRNPFMHHGGDHTDLFRKGDILLTSSSANIVKFERDYPQLLGNVHYFPFMTNPESFNHNIKKDINISFVGSLFMNQKIILDLLEHYKEDHDFIISMHSFIKKIENNYNLDLEAEMKNCGVYNKINNYGLKPKEILGVIANIISNNKRIKALDALSDLGLNLYGTQNWPSGIINYSTKLLSCYQYNTFIKTREELCNIYDRSKIAFNINHHQATTGQGFRVFDILASSALLITNAQENSDLNKIFGENHPIPTYKTPEELRELVIYYLKNEDKRKEIVHKCNVLIDDLHTFNKRAEQIVCLCVNNFHKSKSVDITHFDLSILRDKVYNSIKYKIYKMLKYVVKSRTNSHQQEILKRIIRKIRFP